MARGPGVRLRFSGGASRMANTVSRRKRYDSVCDLSLLERCSEQ